MQPEQLKKAQPRTVDLIGCNLINIVIHCAGKLYVTNLRLIWVSGVYPRVNLCEFYLIDRYKSDTLNLLSW